MNCHLCAGQGHHWLKCPLFGKAEEFIQAYSPQSLAVPEPRPKTPFSLAPNIEEVFGRDSEAALQEILNDDTSPQEEKMLALEVLTGMKHMKKLDRQDQETMASMSHRLLFGSPRPPSLPETSKASPRKDPSYMPDDVYSSVNYDYDRDSSTQPM